MFYELTHCPRVQYIAPPSHLRCSLPARVVDELHLPATLALHAPPDHHHDDEPGVKEDGPHDAQPARLAARARLGVAAPAVGQPSTTTSSICCPTYCSGYFNGGGSSRRIVCGDVRNTYRAGKLWAI